MSHPSSIGPDRCRLLQTSLVTAAQMRQIEALGFDAGLPVAALMEKASQRLAAKIQETFPRGTVGVLAGPGHNGGDALVVARELSLQGRSVQIYCPLASLKPLTEQHRRYAEHLDLPIADTIEALLRCDVVVDGLFGFGLTRPVEGALARDIEVLNRSPVPVVSLDLPSGIETDTGEVLGVAVRSHTTFCLGLWKRAFVAEPALPYLGRCELVDIDLPVQDIQSVLGANPPVQRLTWSVALERLPLERSPTAHKYKVGHLLLVAGSRQYAGAVLLAGQGAVASGVGMLTVAVPEALRLLVVGQLPGALVVGCEAQQGAISALPADLDLGRYDAIAAGPGLTLDAAPVIQSLLSAPVPLVLDADGLNSLARDLTQLQQRPAPTVLTPHPGEFRRLFPHIELGLNAAAAAAQQTQAVIILKGAKTAVADPSGQVWFNANSTPALARGGSGDVLTGLLGGLLAQGEGGADAAVKAALGAVGWHGQAGLSAHQQRSVLGVDPTALAAALSPSLAAALRA